MSQIHVKLSLNELAHAYIKLIRVGPTSEKGLG